MDIDYRNHLYNELTTRCSGLHNDLVLAYMLATWCSGGGSMPQYLGLEYSAYQRMLACHFPGADLSMERICPIILREMPEHEELKKLLLSQCVEQGEEAQWITDIIVAGCAGSNHLWQDLGLKSRTDLSEMLKRNFPSLAAKNVQDMKWKKFLYKQLCLQEGLYICRSPSCDTCIDYGDCFGNE